jgi:hypothetical protein
VASRTDHLALADHNQQTIDYLRQAGDRFPDWITTVAFYKAVHLVDALLAHDHGRHFHDHRARFAALKRENRYLAIYRHFRPLYEASCVARYLQASGGRQDYHQFTDYVPADAVEAEILTARLAPLEKSARKLLSAPARRPRK